MPLQPPRPTCDGGGLWWGPGGDAADPRRPPASGRSGRSVGAGGWPPPAAPPAGGNGGFGGHGGRRGDAKGGGGSAGDGGHGKRGGRPGWGVHASPSPRTNPPASIGNDNDNEEAAVRGHQLISGERFPLEAGLRNDKTGRWPAAHPAREVDIVS
ncbi:hypothetical protein I4F81_003654 [Pyropia yezoensis]|uniref:Uncharacterized protein n=1 Tax=Pyropia yezoensis TaxID=2788 RepID=A0ACC3BT67_PYRYE|nr:hypothetical protein I4F81_003654 [Neopyropia yezoensis]